MRCKGVSSDRFLGGAFSLTEVVLALAVFSLAIVSLLGLMSVALSTQRDSVMETTAANVAAAIINQRRAAPDASPGKAMLLPKVSDMVGTDAQSAMSGSEVVDGLGQTVPATDPDARFICQYRAWGWNDPVTPRLARVHLRMLWPVEIARRDPDRAESYEVFTMMTER